MSNDIVSIGLVDEEILIKRCEGSTGVKPGTSFIYFDFQPRFTYSEKAGLCGIGLGNLYPPYLVPYRNYYTYLTLEDGEHSISLKGKQRVKGCFEH